MAKVKTFGWFRARLPQFLYITLLSHFLLQSYRATAQAIQGPVCVERVDSNRPAMPQVCFAEPGSVPTWIARELSRLNNSGFPFATVFLDTLVEARPVRILARMEFGPLIENGDVVVHGDSAIRSSLVRNGLMFRRGLPFSLRHVQRLPFLASRLTFAEEVKGPDLEWFGNRAMVHVYLRKRRNNGLSGLLGIQPKDQSSGVFLTGNVEASLFNLLGRGLDLVFRWNRFAPSSQTAFLQAKAPYLTPSGLGLEAGLDLIRQDSSLLRRKAWVQILATRPDLIRFFAGLTLFGSEGTLIRRSEGLQSVRLQGLQVGLHYDPDPGYQLIFRRKRAFFQAQAAVKTLVSEIRRNASQLDLQTYGTWPILPSKRRFTLQGIWNSAWLFSDVITAADQFRLGGNRNLRGFNENQFFATQFVQAGLQPQFLLDKQLIGGLFAEVMWYNGRRTGVEAENWRFTRAFGFSLEAELGNSLLQLALANGVEEGQVFDFQTSNIHFGYVGRF